MLFFYLILLMKLNEFYFLLTGIGYNIQRFREKPVALQDNKEISFQGIRKVRALKIIKNAVLNMCMVASRWIDKLNSSVKALLLYQSRYNYHFVASKLIHFLSRNLYPLLVLNVTIIDHDIHDGRYRLFCLPTIA